MSYSDVRSMPIPYRRWFLDRLTDEFKKQEEDRKKFERESQPGRQTTHEMPMGEMMDRLASRQQPPTKDKKGIRAKKFK